MKNTECKIMATSKIRRDYMNVLILIPGEPNNLVAGFGSTLLHVLLERRGSRDGLAWVLILERLRVTGIVHTSSSLTVVVNGGGAHEGSRGRSEGSGAGHQGSDDNHLGLYRSHRERVSEQGSH
jgi:hypothetical protein